MNLSRCSMKKIRELIVFTAFLVVALWKFDVVIEVLKSIWKIVFPFALGGAIAFVINVPMSFLEKKMLGKIKENNNIVSIFCDEDDTSMFLEGYIYAIGRQDFLIKHITPHGLADGYILKKIDSVMHLEISGQYEKKIEKLYSKKNQRHIDLKLQDKVSLKNNIFQICMNNKYIVSIEMIQDDECPIKGVINKIDDNKVIVSKLTEYGEDDGEAILKKENIDTISFLGVDEEDIQLLKRK